MGKPHPVVNKVNQPYWEGASAGELRIQKCGDCGWNWLPAASVCPNCLSENCSWIAASGRGKVFTWLRMHQPYLKAWKDELPYNVALVQLEEGPYLMTNIVGDGDLVCDMAVEVVFPEGDEVALPRFRKV